MAFYAFVECGWCGYHGCAAPFGDNCPRCDHPLQFDAPPTPDRSAVDPDRG